MSDLAEALRDRISALEDEREELEDALNRVTAKIGTLEELLVEEEGGVPTPAPAKRKPGRPKGSKNKKAPAKKRTTKKSTKTSAHAVEDDLWKEATASLPGGASASTPEEQARARARYNPAPRTQPNYGVKAGKPEDVLGDQGKKKSNVSIAVEDD